MSSKKVIVITGASSGIGAATARHAISAGYQVVLAARSTDKINALVRELGEENALAITCDVTSIDDMRETVRLTLKRFGQIDALFANAGIGDSPGKISNGNPEAWKNLILTNIYGVAMSIQVALPSLRETRGNIIITGSLAGRIAISGSMYGVTKWGVRGMGQNLREELRGTGIRVTVLEPGIVDTPFFDNPPIGSIAAEDVAKALVYVLEQSGNVDISELLIQPTPPILSQDDKS